MLMLSINTFTIMNALNIMLLRLFSLKFTFHNAHINVRWFIKQMLVFYIKRMLNKAGLAF
jgi:hypothetical protein